MIETFINFFFFEPLMIKIRRSRVLHPELSDGAQLYELAEVARESYDGYYSVARTCEIGLSQRSGKNYESIVYLVEEATR